MHLLPAAQLIDALSAGQLAKLAGAASNLTPTNAAYIRRDLDRLTAQLPSKMRTHFHLLMRRIYQYGTYRQRDAFHCTAYGILDLIDNRSFLEAADQLLLLEELVQNANARVA
jgi:hypothetical protein